MNNICDISKLSGVFKITNLDENLENLAKMYTSDFNDSEHDHKRDQVTKRAKSNEPSQAQFILKNDVVEIKVRMHRNNQSYYKYWVLESDDPQRENYYFTLKVLFINIRKPTKSNGDAYIENIHKNDTYTGTQIINTILSLLRVLGVKKVRINDATHIVCGLTEENDLSLIKVIETGKTYYQRFGFKYDLSDFYLLKYGTEKNVNRILRSRLKEFKKIKLRTVVRLLQKTIELISSVMQTQDWDDLYIIMHHPTKPYYLKQYLIYDTCLSIIKVYESALKSLVYYQEKYFYQVLIDSFVNDCINHKLYVDIFFDWDIYQITYKNLRVKFDFRDCVKDIVYIRHMGLYLDL